MSSKAQKDTDYLEIKDRQFQFHLDIVLHLFQHHQQSAARIYETPPRQTAQYFYAITSGKSCKKRDKVLKKEV
jgi:hypothetical protein